MFDKEKMSQSEMKSARALRLFLTDRMIARVLLGALLGAFLAGFELIFSYAILVFLTAYHVVPMQSPPAVLGFVFDRSSALAFLFFVGCARAFLFSSQTYWASLGYLEFLRLQRSRLVRISLYGDAVDSSLAHTIFGEYASHSATLLMCVQNVLSQGLSLLCMLVVLVVIAPTTTEILCGIGAIVGWALVRSNLRRPRADASMYEEFDQLYKRFSLALKNLILVQIYGTQAIEKKLIVSGLDSYQSQMSRVYRSSATRAGIAQIVGIGAICLLVPFLGRFDAVESGRTLTYVYLLFRVSQNLGTIVHQGSTARDHLGAFRRVLEWWRANRAAEEASVKPDRLAHAPESRFAAPYAWRIEGAEFSYPGVDRPTIRSLDLRIAPSEVCVIMGESGKGKTTLLNLMIGVLRPDRGTVALRSGENGFDASDRENGFLDRIGYVGPENFVFNGTLRENLIYGLKHRPSEEEFAIALERAECDFVAKLPDGLEYRLTEQGKGLSAGQKQRLALARAFLRKPSALILDEGTSNLDRVTEQRILETLKGLKREMTIIAVTHRDSYVEIADQVITL